MRLKSRVAPLLVGPKFQELFESSFSDNLDETIRNEFPNKNTDVKQYGNINIVTITDGNNEEREIISWYEEEPKRFMDDVEKKEVDAAIKELGYSIIGPSIKDATRKVKEYFGIN